MVGACGAESRLSHPSYLAWHRLLQHQGRCRLLTNVFVRPDQVRGDILTVSGGDASHLARVLRVRVGDRFNALDGTGTEYLVRILSIGEKEIAGEIEARTPRLSEARLRVTLGQALPKGDKMEQVVRRCTELGLAGFWPVFTERCVTVLREEREAHRVLRWQRIAAEAARQSGRGLVPPVAPPKTWDEAIAEFEGYDLVILPWEGENDLTLKRALAPYEQPTRVLVLIGPEGGLTQPEVARAKAAGAIVVTLGPRILRTETAGLVLAAALFYHYDDLAPPSKSPSD